MKKKSCFLAFVLLSSLLGVFSLSGCGKKKDVTVIHAGIQESAVMDFNNMKFLKDMEKATGVRFELEEMSIDKISLMFTSGDYVDVLFGGGCSDTQVMLAANSGDVLELTDDILAKNAPTWKSFFDSNPTYYALAAFEGSKLYSLPYVRTLPEDRGIRDVWWINQKWLKELNLDMPKTLSDFINILRAFKANAGKGSIPENVMPWYFPINSMIGGQFDFYCTFGLPVYDYTFMGVDNGKVVNYATDPKLKTAISALENMYKEGLIAPESLTDNASQYSSRISKVESTPYIGVYTAYYSTMDDYVPMPVFESIKGVKPLIRQSQIGLGRNKMIIFKNCKYPDKVLKAMEWIAQERNSVYLDFGVEGTNWDYDSAKNKYIIHNVKNDSYSTPGNLFPGLLNDRFTGRMSYDDGHPWAKRIKAIELYKDNRIPIEQLLPPLGFSAAATEKVDNYRLNICQRYINKSTSNWVSGTSDIASTWDEYVSQVKALGMEDYVSLYQEAYDKFMALAKR